MHSGFLPNSETSVWVPTLVINWLGFTIDLFQGLLFIPGRKIKRVLSDVNSILEANCSSARELSALAGRINSFNLAVGNATTLMTKVLHMSIVLQSSWDSKFLLPPSLKEELIFWKDNVRCFNGRPIGRLDYQPLFGKGARAPPPNSRLDSWTLVLLISTNNKSACLNRAGCINYLFRSSKEVVRYEGRSR